jgi:hypothetical protein
MRTVSSLFCAFLISLLISMYDRYKPVHDARFTHSRAVSPAAPGRSAGV